MEVRLFPGDVVVILGRRYRVVEGVGHVGQRSMYLQLIPQNDGEA